MVVEKVVSTAEPMASWLADELAMTMVDCLVCQLVGLMEHYWADPKEPTSAV